jgi:membrane-associated phospholipid phosphatase
MGRLARWPATMLAAMGALVLLFLFVDRPAATWAHAAFGEAGHGEVAKRVFIALTHIVDPFVPLAVAGLFLSGAALATGRGRVFAERALFAACAATLAAIAAKDWLKFAFGRLWPETWVNGNPSWIADGAYGFTPFHGGAGWASFPSGHMTVITVPFAVLALARPAWRWAAAVAPVLVALGLYGADYHFLSDILAGTLLGAACALLVWEAVMPRDMVRRAGR